MEDKELQEKIEERVENGEPLNDLLNDYQESYENKEEEMNLNGMSGDSDLFEGLLGGLGGSPIDMKVEVINELLVREDIIEDWAELQRRKFNALIDEGFTDEEAIELIKNIVI